MVIRLMDPDPFSLEEVFIEIGIEVHPIKTFSVPIHAELHQYDFPTSTSKLNRTPSPRVKQES